MNRIGKQGMTMKETQKKGASRVKEEKKDC